jgi:hypothetical protein
MEFHHHCLSQQCTQSEADGALDAVKIPNYPIGIILAGSPTIPTGIQFSKV